jgi:hypothetical protein
MATTFKQLGQNDVTNTRTLLHEAIPMTGSLLSGTYGSFRSETNVKNFSHGMFQSVYDYPYLSSSANHIIDITMGYTTGSNNTTTHIQNAKKVQIYNQMAQVLMGHDVSGNIQQFDRDGNILAGGAKHKEVYFLSFSRLLVKDEIKKGSFSMTMMTGGTLGNPTSLGINGSPLVLTDLNANTDFRVNSPAGEYGVLYSGSTAQTSSAVGLIYYQAGIVVLTSSVFGTSSFATSSYAGGMVPVKKALTGTTIQENCNFARHRIANISFNNTTELNSTIYFCRANHNEFNYSSNPTYLSSSRIRVKEKASDNPKSYITTVGLYSPDNELLAVAKTSEPIKKTPANEFTLRVRLDY